MAAALLLALAPWSVATPQVAERSPDYARFLSTHDPEALVTFAQSLPMATISSDLAAYPRELSPLENTEVVASDEERVLFGLSAFTGDHLFFTRMTTVQGPDDHGNENAWWTVLFHSSRTDGEWTAPQPIVEGLIGLDKVVPLRTADGGIVLILGVRNGSPAFQFGAKPGGYNLLRADYQGRWSSFEPLLDSSLKLLHGFDAAFDQTGKIHIVYSPWTSEKEMQRVHHLILDSTGRRTDTAFPAAAGRNLLDPVIVRMDRSPLVIASGQQPGGGRIGKFLIGADFEPRPLTDDTPFDHSVAKSAHESTFATFQYRDRPQVAWWVFRKGPFAVEKRLWTVDTPDAAPGIIRGGDDPIFSITRDSTAYFVRQRKGRSEAVAVAHREKGIEMLSVLVGEDLVELVFTDRSSIRRGTLRLSALPWRPMREAIWRNTRGRGLGETDRSVIHQLMRSRLGQASQTERLRILQAIVRDFPEDQNARERLDKACAGQTVAICIEYIERRDAAECRDLMNWSDKCRARLSRQLSERCSSGSDSTAECIRWRYETGRAVDPFLQAAFDDEAAQVRTTRAGSHPWQRLRLAEFRRAAILESAWPDSGWKFTGEDFLPLTRLLRDRDPRVRGAAARELAQIDLPRATPFLVGLLTDCGSWVSTIPSDVVTGPLMVCRIARDHLVYRYPYFDVLKDGTRVPLDDPDPLAADRAFQRYVLNHYKAHLPQQYRGGSEFVYFRAIALELGVDSIAAKALAQRSEIKSLVRFDLLSESSTLRFQRGTPVFLQLILRNLGRTDVRVRVNLRDSNVHRLRLIGPDGNDRTLFSERLPAFPHFGDMVISGDFLHSEGHRLGVIGTGIMSWPLDLQRLFDLSQPGRYRLEYEYNAAGTSDQEGFAPVEHFHFWDGRQYTRVFEFEVISG